MNKNAIRLVALLVVHCLLVDPATASALSPSASGGVSISQDLPRFSEEAFSARAAFQLAPPRLVMARIVALAVGVGALISITAHSTPADTLAYQAGAYGATGIVASGTTVVGSGTPAGHLGIIVLGALGIIWGFKHLGRILNAVLIDPRNYFKDGVIGTFFHHLKNLGHIHSTLAFIAACGWVLELSIVSLVHPGNPTGVLKMLSQFTPMGDVRFAAAAVVAALVMLYFDKKYNPSENGHPMAGTSAAGSIGEPLATGRLEDSSSALSLSGTYVRGIPPLRRVQAESIEYGHPTEWIVRSTVADLHLLREYNRAVLQNRLADLPRDENGLLDVERRWIQVHVAPDDLREFLFHTFRPTSFAHAHIPEYLMGQARESVKQSLEQASLYMHTMVMKSVRGAIAKTAWLVPLFVFFTYVSAADILPSWVPVFRVPDLNLPHPIQWVVLLLIPLSMLVSICVVWKAARQTHREAHKAYNVSTFSRALTLPGGPPAAGPSRSDEDRQPSGGRTINGIATGGLVGRPLAALYHWLIRKFHLSHYEIRTVYAPIIETIVFQGLFIGLPMLLGYFHNGLRGIVHWGALGVVFSPLIYGSQLTHPLIYRRSTYAEKPATREESQTLIGRGLLVSLRFYVHALLPIAVYWILSFYEIWRGLPVGSFNMPHTLLIIYLFVAALEGLIAAALFHRKTNKSSDLQGVATGGRSGQNGPTEWKPGTDLAPANWIRLLKHLEVHGGNFDSESVSMAINSTAARSSLGRHNGSLILKNIYYLLTGSSETSVLDPARTLVLVEFAQRVLMGLAMRPIGEPTHDTYSIMSLLRYNPTAKQVKKILTPEEIVRFIDRAKEILGISQSPAQSYRTAA